MADDDSAVFFDATSQHGETEAPVDENIIAGTTINDIIEADVDEATVASSIDENIVAAAAMHDPLEADIDEATLASGFDVDNAAAAANEDPLEFGVDEAIVDPAAGDGDLRENAFHHISNNPVRVIQPKKGWKSAQVNESHNVDNYQPIFQYLCRLYDFPACFDRQNRQFIKCRCLKKLSFDDLQLVAQSIG